MQTSEILDLFNMGETADGAEMPGLDSSAAAAAQDEMDHVDIDGEVKEKGKKGWLDDLGELWEDRQYEEEFSLDGFLEKMKG